MGRQTRLRAQQRRSLTARRTRQAIRARATHQTEIAVTAQDRVPTLGSLKVPDVRPADVENLHSKVTKAGAPIRANRCISTLSKMMGLAIRWEYRDTNPISHA
jgi:hypothetical protein